MGFTKTNRPGNEEIIMEKKEIQTSTPPLSTTLQITGYALILLGFLFFFMYPYFQPYTITYTQKILKKICDQKNEALADWVTSYTQKARTHATDQHIIKLLTSSWDMNSQSNMNVPKGCLDTLVIDRSGTVRSVTHKTHFIGQNFLTGNYKNSPLGMCIQLVNSTLATQFSRFDNAFTKDTMSLFVATPIIEQEKFIGFLVLEINPASLFLLIEDRSLLGKTGEIVLGQAHNNQTFFINKPRFSPTLQFQSVPSTDTTLYGATKGKQESGIITDYRKKTVIAAWDYVPTLDAGIMVKQDLKEALLYFNIITLSIFLFVIMLIIAFFSFAYKKQHTRLWVQSTSKKMSIKLKNSFCALWIYVLLGLLGFMGCFFIQQYKSMVIASNHDAQTLNISNLRSVAHTINQEFHAIQSSAKRIAADLSNKTIDGEEIKNEILAELENNKALHSITIAYQPHAYDNEKELYAPTWIQTKRGVIIQQLEDSYNYTLPETAGGMQTDWFLHATHGQQGWHGPLDKKTNNKNVLIYSVPFFNPNDSKRVQGVVALCLRLKTINALIENLGLGLGEKCVMIDQRGRFIYHPNRDLVRHKRTVNDQVDENGSRQSYQDLLKKHLNIISSATNWIYVEKIPLPQWLIASSFLPEHVQHNQQALLNTTIKIIVSLILFLLVLCWLMLPCYVIEKRLFYKISSLLYSIIVLSGCCSLWWFIHHQKWEPSSSNFIVKNKVRLQKYLEHAHQEHIRKNLPAPITIKTGITLKIADFINPTTIGLDADLWQKYHDKDHTSLSIPYVNYPAAEPKIDELAKLYLDYQPRLSISKKVKLTMSESFRKKDQETTLIGWKAHVELKLDEQYAEYPFNKTDLVITLRQKDPTKGIIPIPDFGEYHATPDKPHPWIDHSLSFPGYTIEDTFFSYQDKPQTESELPEAKKLDLHVVLKRNLLNPFYLYFMPFLVILFTIFSVLNADALSRVTAYTGLLFATILLNQSLRSALQISDIIYVEYLFFFTYITLLLLITQGIWARLNTSEELQKMIEKTLMLLFWPFQLTLWFITTLFVFYK